MTKTTFLGWVSGVTFLLVCVVFTLLIFVWEIPLAFRMLVLAAVCLIAYVLKRLVVDPVKARLPD
jgi:hypothetical protein